MITVMSLLALLTLLPARSADAVRVAVAPSDPASGANPLAAVADAERMLRDTEADADRLRDDRRRAAEALDDARTKLAARVTDRKEAEADQRRAEQDVAAAAADVQRAAVRLAVTTQHLGRLVDHRDAEDGKLEVEAREAYKEASGRLVAAAVALNVMFAEADPAAAIRTADRVSQLAARRAAEVRRVTALADSMGREQAEQGRLLIMRHQDHGLAIDRLNARRDALEDRRRREAEQEARVQRAGDEVAVVDAAQAANARLNTQLHREISDWRRQLAALRTDAMRAPVPAELARYGNGRIPAGALTPIGVGHHRLWAPAAGAFKALHAAAAADGVVIRVTDSYRSYDAQVTLVGQKGLYAQGGLAARPGSSEHGWGLALDLDLSAAGLHWMRSNAGTYGFVENTPREPWHWVFTARP